MINSIIEQGESKTLEFKESLPKNDSIAKTAIAFSNTSGGRLIIGVNDKREIVGIYDDIVNIVSPGSFPNTITSQDIANGRSEARNKVIANIFKELGLIEQWGSGINRIKTICTTEGLQEPKIEEQNDFVDVEFFRMQSAKVSDVARYMPDTARYMPEQEKKILLTENSFISITEALIKELFLPMSMIRTDF